MSLDLNEARDDAVLGTVATFYRCGGQNRNCLGQIFSGFFVSKIMKIGSFLTELLKN